MKYWYNYAGIIINYWSASDVTFSWIRDISWWLSDDNFWTSLFFCGMLCTGNFRCLCCLLYSTVSMPVLHYSVYLKCY